MKLLTILLGLAILMASVVAAGATPPWYDCDKHGVPPRFLNNYDGTFAVDPMFQDKDGNFFFGVCPENEKCKIVYTVYNADSDRPETRKPLPKWISRQFRWKDGDLYYRGKRCVI